jgi:transposase-like protein
MKRIPQGRYSKEFREEAVKLVVVQGLNPHFSLDPISIKIYSQ